MPHTCVKGHNGQSQVAGVPVITSRPSVHISCPGAETMSVDASQPLVSPPTIQQLRAVALSAPPTTAAALSSQIRQLVVNANAQSDSATPGALHVLISCRQAFQDALSSSPVVVQTNTGNFRFVSDRQHTVGSYQAICAFAAIQKCLNLKHVEGSDLLHAGSRQYIPLIWVPPTLKTAPSECASPFAIPASRTAQRTPHPYKPLRGTTKHKADRKKSKVMHRAHPTASPHKTGNCVAAPSNQFASSPPAHPSELIQTHAQAAADRHPVDPMGSCSLPGTSCLIYHTWSYSHCEKHCIWIMTCFPHKKQVITLTFLTAQLLNSDS